MNRISFPRQVQILASLVEGCSIRATERMTNTHRDTIMRLGVAVGHRCSTLLGNLLRKLPCSHLQVDELWTFIRAKQNPVWTFCGLDRESKAVLAWTTGQRDQATAFQFLQLLKSRLDCCPSEISTDGFRPYLQPIAEIFGPEVNFGQLIKDYSGDNLRSVHQAVISGNPTQICTSHVERQNLTMRMHMRRFTRLTNAFSKKLENLKAALGLHFAWYNLVRIHSSLRITPAMALRVTDHIWSLEELLETTNGLTAGPDS